MKSRTKSTLASTLRKIKEESFSIAMIGLLIFVVGFILWLMGSFFYGEWLQVATTAPGYTLYTNGEETYFWRSPDNRQSPYIFFEKGAANRDTWQDKRINGTFTPVQNEKANHLP